MPSGIYNHKKGRHWKLSEETKQKMSEIKRGIKHPLYGKHHSEETRKKMSEARKGKPNGRLGKHHTEETKRKISKSNKGKNKGTHRSEETKKKISESNKGRIGYWLGKKFTKKTRRKLSEAHKGKKFYLWKGGITPINLKIRNGIEYRLWREAVFARDNWTCQKYEIKGGRLVAHHINNFAEKIELRFAIDNGITLSKKAHKEFHRKYGIKNNTKEQLNEFLTK